MKCCSLPTLSTNGSRLFWTVVNLLSKLCLNLYLLQVSFGWKCQLCLLVSVIVTKVNCREYSLILYILTFRMKRTFSYTVTYGQHYMCFQVWWSQRSKQFITLSSLLAESDLMNFGKELHEITLSYCYDMIEHRIRSIKEEEKFQSRLTFITHTESDTWLI